MRWLHPSYRLAALAFVVTVVYWPAIFSAPFMPRWWAIAIGLPLLCDLDVRRVDPLTGCIALLGLGGAFLVSVAAADWISSLLPLYFLALVVVAFVAGASTDRPEIVMSGFAFGAVLSSVICGFQVLGESSLPSSAGPGGLFFNSEVLAEFAAPLFVWAIISRKWPIALAIFVPLAVCHSKIAILASCVGLLYLWRPSRVWIRPAVMLAVIVAGFAALLFIWPDKLQSADNRMVLWGAAVYSLTPFGQGLGWWASAHPFGFEEFVHSDALQFLVEIGIFGLPFIALPIVIFHRGITDKAQGACFAALCFEALVSFPLHVPATAFLFAVVAGSLARVGAGVRVAQRDGGIARGVHVQRPAAHDPAIARCSAGVGGNLRDRSPHPIDPGKYPQAGFRRAAAAGAV